MDRFFSHNSISRCLEKFLPINKHERFNTNVDFNELNNNFIMKTVNQKIGLIIKEFDSLSNIVYNNDHPLHLTSNRVRHTDLPNVEWELCLKIKKENSSIFLCNQACCIWLRQIGPDSLNGLINTRYRIYAIKNHQRVDIARSTNKLESQEGLGITQIKLERILDGRNMDLYCEIEADCYNSTDNLKKTYHNMLNKGTYSDFIIKVGNEVIETHRCVLAQNSSIFKKMFEQEGFKEAQEGEVTISDCSPECVHGMLEFFYTRETENLAKHVNDVFNLAHLYESESLVYECECVMSSNISVQNIKKYCNIICTYGASTLERACKNFIRTNRKTFLNSKEWEELKNNFPQLTYRLLENVIDDFD